MSEVVDSTGYPLHVDCYVRVDQSDRRLKSIHGWVLDLGNGVISIEHSRTGSKIVARTDRVTLVPPSPAAIARREVLRVQMYNASEGARRMHRARPMKRSR